MRPGFIGLCIVAFLSSSAAAQTVSGRAIDLKGNGLSGVTVEAFAVSPDGILGRLVDRVTSESEKKDAAGKVERPQGFYSIDVKGERRVVLRFSQPGIRKTVDLPEAPSVISGGALFVEQSVTNIDVVVPEVDRGTVTDCAPTYWYSPRHSRCFDRFGGRGRFLRK